MDELYVVARRVLLDALEAIGPHRDAVVIVGAHAVYLRVGDADLAVAPYTTDGDLAIDPAILGEIPPLERALGEAGFVLETKQAVGAWTTHRSTRDNQETKVGIDLLVPEMVSPGSGRRSARLSGHNKRAARKVQGLEGALVDLDILSISALDDADDRVVDARVAGPAALLVSKVHKIRDRAETPRLKDKDALDVFRLLRGVQTDEFAARMVRLLRDPISQPVAEEALGLLAHQFGNRGGLGIAMAQRAAGVLVDHDEIAASCEALTADLREELDRS